MKLINNLLKQIYPEPVLCPGCDDVLHGYNLQLGLCGQCMQEIQIFTGSGLTIGEKEKVLQKQYFDHVWGVALYTGKIKDLIYQFKYFNQRELIYPLVELMVRQFTVVMPKENWDGLIPVPMHQARCNERGYNQSLLLALGLSIHLKIPCCDWFLRSEKTLPQNQLNILERRKNIRGVFKLKDGLKIDGGNWLIVDDIFTTGATANELARLLKKSGGKKVGVYVLASGRLM